MSFLDEYVIGPIAETFGLVSPEQRGEMRRASKEIAKGKEHLKKLAEKAKKINSNHQLLLGRDMEKYIRHWNSNHNPEYPVKNYTNILGKNVQATRSHLFGTSGMENFVAIDSAKISTLVPSVRLFQELRDQDGKLTGRAELAFSDFLHPESVLSSRNMRGDDAGLKEVSIDLEGDSIATADRAFRVKIKIYFNSLSSLFKERQDAMGTKYKYTDLFTYLARDPSQADSVGDQTLKILRLEYGYHEPKDKTIWDKSEHENLASSIRESKRVLSLNLYKHNLNYNENGSIILDLEYHGYTERQASKIDVFLLGMDEAARARYRESFKAVKKKRKANQAPNTSESDSAELKKMIEEVTKQKKTAYESFVKSILEVKEVHNATYAVQHPILPVLSLANLKTGKKAESLSECLVNNKSIQIFKDNATERLQRDVILFFYLGDLIDNVLRIAKEEPSLKGFNYSLGSFMFKRSASGKSIEIPISGIPIAMKSFTEWFEENVIKKGERETYDLSSFLTDVVNLALTSFSPETILVASAVTPPSPQLRSGIFNTLKPLPKGDIKDISTGKQFKSSDFKNGIDSVGIQSNYHIYGVNVFAERGYTGSPSDDAKQGIYWLVAGTEKGIVKKISYSKADAKHLTEMRMTTAGFSDKQKVLWSLYKAKVDLVGTPIFQPGMVVYLTSAAFDQSDAELIGLGGYFMVLKVGNSIQGGKFTTQLDTIWVKPNPTEKHMARLGSFFT